MGTLYADGVGRPGSPRTGADRVPRFTEVQEMDDSASEPMDERVPITVLFFSFAADRVGSRRVQLDVPLGATVADVFAQYADQLGVSADRFVFAVDEKWVPPGHVLAAGEVLAVIPPVAGG